MAVAHKAPFSPEQERMLMTELWDPQLADNLYAWIMYAYPWGKPNTPLANFKGPRNWQRDELDQISEHIRSNRIKMARGETPDVYQSATGSGRGPGKSALVAWANHWMLSTRIGSSIINTANTEGQLKTKTWAEVGKWHTLAINSHWFEKQALSLKPAPWFEDLVKTQLKIDTGYYYALATLWSEENPDAAAGAHNHNGEMVVFDEASGIPSPIWTVFEGFFTEPILDRYWLVFSNCRRNSGAFYDCFHVHRNYWRRRNIDSRTVEGTDKKRLQSIVDKYGEDSDEARVEVKGQFPRQGDHQFISREVIQDAQERELQLDPYAALIMGVDPARYGSDETVIRFRQGRDAKSLPPVKMKGLDNMAVSNKCAELITERNPDAVCIDAGNGTGIIDRLREMGFRVHEVWFGGKAESLEWRDRRTELWAFMREWLKGGCIDDDADLASDLAGPEYKFQGPSERIKLESKEDMKKRGLSSPDNGDALALTFHVKVARRDSHLSRGYGIRNRVAKDVDYPVFGE